MKRTKQVAGWAVVAVAACGRASAPAPQEAGSPPVVAATSGAEAGGAAPGSTAVAAAPRPGTRVELGGTTEQGRFKVSVVFDTPRVGQLFAVEATVLPTAATADIASVDVDATMPAHRHGMMTRPVSERSGPNRWKIDGMKLHMHGAWVFHVGVHADGKLDEIQLPFDQPPEAVGP